MTFEIRQILKSKQALRQRLAALPYTEKLRMLDVLRERSLTIAASRKKQQDTRNVKEIQQGMKEMEGGLECGK